jgi:hypothetical protein
MDAILSLIEIYAPPNVRSSPLSPTTANGTPASSEELALVDNNATTAHTGPEIPSQAGPALSFASQLPPLASSHQRLCDYDKRAARRMHMAHQETSRHCEFLQTGRRDPYAN